MLKLNSIDRHVFDAAGTDAVTVKCNGKEINRRDLVAVGRLVACEYVGKKLNTRPDVKSDPYVSRLNGKNLSDLSKMHSDSVFMFCATMANKAVGKEAPESVEEAKRNLSYAKDRTFLATLAAITRDVIQPLYAKVFDDVAGQLMQFEEVPFGGTKEIDILSNDVFMFEDSSWGSGRSSTYNQMYGKTITLNPRPYQCNVRMKWYQSIVNGDAGAYYAAVMNGMWNKMYAIFMGKLLTASSNTDYIPSGLTASGYTSGNFAAISTLVAAANGVKRSDLLAFGTIGVLSKVLPVDGASAAITGLQYGLGEEWFKRGYLPNAAGVQLLEVEPAIVPGTQNSTLQTIDTGSNLFIAAKAGVGYAPIYVGYFEGSPFTLEFTPSDGTADYSILMDTTAMFDMKAVFGSKIGVITSIS